MLLLTKAIFAIMIGFLSSALLGLILIPILKKLKIPVFSTYVKYGEEVKNLSHDEKEVFALIIGNEGNGVNPKYLEMSDKFIYIPMNDVVESLNVGVATSIILYEMDEADD